ncbi:MAG: M16 family metallopeptidase, partial [Dolichospermum sp.]
MHQTILNFFMGNVKNSPFRRLLATTLALMVFSGGLIPETALALQKSPNSIQPYLEQVINRLTEFRLDNGLKFIVLERHQAPVVSFLTYADVGGIDEPDGQTGVAHFLEHLAFKGTKRIGTTDYKAEAPLLAKLEQLDNQIKTGKANSKKDEIARLETEFKSVESQAIKLVKQNEMGQIVEQAGGVGLNATTSSEATRYFYSFPANK